MEVTRNVVQAIHVICVGVRRQDIINTVKAAPPEIFRDDRFADASGVALKRLCPFSLYLAPSRVIESWPTASINQQRRAVRHRHQRRIALPDIQEINSQPAAWSACAKRMNDDQNEHGDECDCRRLRPDKKLRCWLGFYAKRAGEWIPAGQRNGQNDKRRVVKKVD